MHPDILEYNARQAPGFREVCDLLAREIDRHLTGAEGKVWHAHPVWFLDGNPTVGSSKQKPGIRLVFWSGADFEEGGLNIVGKKFEDASVFYEDLSQVETSACGDGSERHRRYSGTKRTWCGAKGGSRD